MNHILFYQIIGGRRKKRLEKKLSKIQSLCSGENPTFCRCNRGESERLFPPFESIADIKTCRPKKCKCPEIEELVQISKPFDPENMPEKLKARLDEKMNQLNKLCPGQKAPDSCSCRRDHDPIVAPFVDPEVIFKCRPKICQCENGVEVKMKRRKGYDASEQEKLDQVNTLCPEGETPEDCPCQNEDSEEEVPFESLEALKDCDPKRCQCSEGLMVDVPIVTEQHKLLDAVFAAPAQIMDSCPGSERPNSCLCQNGENLDLDGISNNADPKLIRCRPKKCLCEEEMETEIASEKAPDEIAQLIKKKLEPLNQICGKSSVKECPCLTDPDWSIKPPFEDLAELASCAPKNCLCEDGTQKDLSELARPVDESVLEEYLE